MQSILDDKDSEDRRGSEPKPLSYYTVHIALLTFLVQLILGAAAYGRLEGRVTSMENEIHLILERSLNRP